MKELRIMLPDELWGQFEGQSPQSMKRTITTLICLQFNVKPESKQSKPRPSSHQNRGHGGRFTRKGSTARLLDEAGSATNCGLVQGIRLEPKNQRENTVQLPENPQSACGMDESGPRPQTPQTPRENTVQPPVFPREVEVPIEETQRELTVLVPENPQEMKVMEEAPPRKLKISQAYAIGLKP